MRISRLAFAAALSCLLAPLSAVAQGKGAGELWEITMNIPGMPAGMMKPQRVCQGDDPSRAATQDPSKKDCKVTGTKKTALGTTVILSCPDGSTMTIDQQYTSAARTEFKSTMTSKGGRDGEFTMNMTGRKVGACDAVAENKARDAKIDDMKKQLAAGQAQSAAAMKQQSDSQIKQCSAALESMSWNGFGAHGHCYKRTDGQCAQFAEMHKHYPEATKACNANLGEFCKRFQTADGFMKARSDENAAKMCGVSSKAIKTAQCPKTQNLAFLGAYCPVQAKPIAMEHCTGRDYTSRNGGKYNVFCSNYLANEDFERPPGAARPAAGTVPARAGTPPAGAGSAPAPEKTQGDASADAVKEGVSQGINKLRGLFGR
jgi:hypothetical protein